MYVCVCSHMCTCVFNYKLIRAPRKKFRMGSRKSWSAEHLFGNHGPEPFSALCSPIFSTTLGRRPQEHSSGVTMITLLLESLRATFKFSQSPDRGISEQEGCTAKPLDREGFYRLPCRLYLWECREGAEVSRGMVPRRSGQMPACLEPPGASCGLPEERAPPSGPAQNGRISDNQDAHGDKGVAACVLPASFSSCASGRTRDSFK